MTKVRQFKRVTFAVLVALLWLASKADAAQCGSTAAGNEAWGSFRSSHDKPGCAAVHPGYACSARRAGSPKSFGHSGSFPPQ